MKKVIPFALLICVLFSLSAFSPLTNNAKAGKTHQLWWFPTSGVLVGATGGDANWAISGGNITPHFITFTRGTSSWGPYYFSSNGGSSYVAGGPRELGVIQSWVINDAVSFVTIW